MGNENENLNGVNYNETQNFTSQPQKKSSGLAIAALVLGIVSILGSWVPVFNIVSIICAIIGVILGIVAVVKKQPKGFCVTGLILSILAIIIAIIMNVIAVYFVKDNIDDFKADFSTIPGIEEKDDSSTKSDSSKKSDSSSSKSNAVAPTDLKINQASYNGVTITFPATKESFNGTGWTWDAKYADTDLANNYTTTGGRIGKYPGGVVVSVVNTSGETKKIQDCTIDTATFYNPKDGSENVTFIGGLDYSSTIDQVKTTMSNLGYNNVDERNYDTANYLKYYKDDNKDNYRDYIEFYYYKDSINSVTVHADYRK